MELNRQQLTGWLRIGLAAGGPLGAAILDGTHMAQSSYELYVNAFLYAGVPTICAAWEWAAKRRTAQVAAVAQMPPEVQKEALSKVSDVDKVLIAKAVPGVATVVVRDVANGALADLAANENHRDIVTETQNEIDARMGTKIAGGII